MDIVAKRNSEKAFTDTTFHRLMLNSIALFLTWFVPALLKQSTAVARLTPSGPALATYTTYAIYLSRAVLLWNILDAGYKFLRPADEFTDIPLTPEQRKLFGLNPDTPLSATASGGAFVTPPRYTKSTTSSRSGSPNFGVSTSSPNMARNAAATPPPMTPSPLRMGGAVERRTSGGFGSLVFGGSPVASGKVGSSSVVPGNKWIYEKNLQRKSMPFSPRPSWI
ncbi:hypothetical protein Q9L58_000861 [Maublancomyces gigas]|uniref:Nucleoporin POM34 n=1 Tax=Discina gigas TaxID=1032678 RepID=A0ABR3GVQ8_9PEZI